MPQFNRFNPSPRYRELIGLYQTLHVEGDKLHDIPAEQTFDGQSLVGHVVTIAQLVADFAIQTVLDYGSGAGATGLAPTRPAPAPARGRPRPP